jgi:deoxyribodipyrimidine photo-lyase
MNNSLKKRSRKLNQISLKSLKTVDSSTERNARPAPHITYWMSREQRIEDNWALIFAQELAQENNLYFEIIFNLKSNFLDATYRHYKFMLEGLEEISQKTEKLNIPFRILHGNPTDTIPKHLAESNSKALITDFSPLREALKEKDEIAKEIKIPFYEVDGHNIIPCWLASDKKEYAAWTFRKKVNEKLNEFLINFPEITAQSKKLIDNEKLITRNLNFHEIKTQIDVAKTQFQNINFKGGSKTAFQTLENFINNKINKYSEYRNDPNQDVLSNLSPYLHFGQISSQKIALTIKKHENLNTESTEEFLEELIVRKELSDNFCFYEKNYDSFKGFPDWAKKTLNTHRSDPREYIYDLEELEKAETHDNLWNGAQKQMLITGKMHGYMRMYWGKKILEWSRTPGEALETANYLNNKYELDGRDPNGYAGTAWSIGGVHDRAWAEREIFGKIRYMNYNGAKRKFDVDKYVNKIQSLIKS